jgi:hypothetical protein
MRVKYRLAIALLIFGPMFVSAPGMRIESEAIPGYGISHYHIQVEIVPAQKHLSARAVLTVEGLTADITTIRVYLHQEFNIHGIWESGKPLKFVVPEAQDKPMYSPSAKAIDIELSPDVLMAGSKEIEIDYSGPINRTINGVNLISEGLTEIALYCAWFPMLRENQNFTYSLMVTLPEGQRVVCDSEISSEAVKEGKVTWRCERRTPGYDIPLIASGNLKVKVRETEAMKTEVYFRQIDESLIDDVLDQAIRAAEIMTEKFGDPTTKGRLTVVYSPRSGWGYSRIPLIVGPEENYLRRLKSDKGKIENFHGLAHEIGHFWWSVASTSTTDDWINESLAEFSSLYATERVFGRAEVAKILKNYTTQILSLANAKPILETKRDERSAYVLFYEKGSYLFEMLRSMIGEEKLFSILKSFYRKHRGGRTAVTADLLSFLVDAGGEKIRPFLNEYLTTNSLPKVDLEWDYRDGRVKGKVTVKESALVIFPLEIFLSTEDGAQSDIITIPVSSGDNPFDFALTFRPGIVTIDPNDRLLWTNPDLLYRSRFVPLVHGPNMDFWPDIIPEENIEKAGQLLAEWQSQSSGSPFLNFELGWYWFLKKDYRKAAGYLEKVVPYAQALDVIGVLAYGALGRCWDLVGDRAKAIGYYEKGERLADEFGLNDLQRKGMLGDFRRTAYQRGKTIHMAALTGDLALVKELATVDPDLTNAKDDIYGRTPAFFAIMTKVHLDILEWLLDHGADISATDPSGRTLLSIAKSKSDKALVDYLISRGAKEE